LRALQRAVLSGLIAHRIAHFLRLLQLAPLVCP
jgi:hypothetical protein